MRGVENPQKEIIVEELKRGVPSSELSKKYGVAMSTITTWIKALPRDCTKSKFDFKNRRISVMRKVNMAEAKISDMIADYVVCDISDDEWEAVQKFIQHELIEVATFTGEDEEGTMCDNCLFCK
ncbi:MAG: helix-turn-helix domain containing protein [Bacilli bacterium]|nr:helix-turn-helix domain containing protein [Bacilli bacterium]